VEFDALVHRERLAMPTLVQKNTEGAFVTGVTSVKAQVADLDALVKIRVSGYKTGDSVFVGSEGKNYVWITTSRFATDNKTVFVPTSYKNATAPIGRWIVQGEADSSAAQLSSDQIAKSDSIVLVKKTIAELKNARVSVRIRGESIRVSSLDKVFVWIPNSKLKADDVNIVLPNSYAKASHPIGRWVCEGVSLRTGEIPQSEQPTTTTTTQVTSLNNLILPIRTVTFSASPLSILDTDGVLLVDTTSGNVDVSVPDPATIPVGRLFTIRKVDHSTNVVNIVSQGSALIDTLASITLNNIGGCSLISDGTNYFILP